MHPSDERSRGRAEVTEVATRLVSEYSGLVPAGEVLACVARCQEELRRAGVTSALAAAIDLMAHRNLDRRIPAHPGCA